MGPGSRLHSPGLVLHITAGLYPEWLWSFPQSARRVPLSWGSGHRRLGPGELGWSSEEDGGGTVVTLLAPAVGRYGKLGNERMDDETKRLLCRMVAGLVASDEEFTDSERAFVEKVLGEFGIPEEEWDAIYPLVDPDEARAEIAKLNGTAREMAVNLLVQAAAADGKIVEEELRYLNSVVDAMAVHSSVIEFRLRKIMGDDWQPQ